MKKDILKGLDSELKKRGVKVGQKRGAYNKKVKEVINSHDNFIKDIIIESKPFTVEIKNTNEPNLVTANVFNQNENETPPIEGKKEIETETNKIIDTETEKTETKQIELPVSDGGETSFRDFINANADKTEYKEVKAPIKSDFKEVPNNMSEGMKKLITGRMLLNICNVIFPSIIIKVVGIFNKNVRELETNEVKLTPEQINELSVVADAIAQYIFSKINPIQAFFLMYAFFTMSNIQVATAKRKLASA